jgi:hypothetical protein
MALQYQTGAVGPNGCTESADVMKQANTTAARCSRVANLAVGAF